MTDIKLQRYLEFTPYFAGSSVEDKINRTKFINLFILLPVSIKSLLSSAESAETIYSLGEKYGLNVTQIEMLSLAVRNILSGIVYIKNMPNLIESLNIDELKARSLTSELLNGLFAPAIEDIKKVQREKFDGPANPPKPRPVMMQPQLRSMNRPQPPAPPTNVNPGNVVDLRNK